MRLGHLRRLNDARVHRSVRVAVGDVFADRAVEQKDILADQADGSANVFLPQLAQVIAIKQHPPGR